MSKKFDGDIFAWSLILLLILNIVFTFGFFYLSGNNYVVLLGLVPVCSMMYLVIKEGMNDDYK